MKTALAKIKGFFVRLWAWFLKDGKTNTVAILYATGETLLAMPDFATMTWQDFAQRTVRIVSVTAIGLLARDRKKMSAQEIATAEDKHNVPKAGRKDVDG